MFKSEILNSGIIALIIIIIFIVVSLIRINQICG